MEKQNDTVQEYGNHIVQYPEEYSLCVGCKSCELICAITHDGVTGPTHSRIQAEMGSLYHLRTTVYACQHCSDYPCYDACPKKDAAMCIDKNGIVYINEDQCIGCGLCAKKCKFTPSRIIMDRKNRKAKKCDLCRNRPEGPMCIEHCPVRCIGLSNDPLPYEIGEEGGILQK